MAALPVRSRALVFLAPFLFGLFLWNEWGKNDAKELSFDREKTVPSSAPIEIKGFSFKEYQSDRLRAKIDADVFKIDSRKFGIFSIQPVQEAVFTHPHVEVYLMGDRPPSEIVLFPFSMGEQKNTGADQRPSLFRGAGLITRVVLNRPEIQIYTKDDRFASLKIVSGRAIIRLRQKEMRFQDVFIENLVLKRSIKSPLAIWDNPKKRFHLPGEYLLKTDKGEATGKNMNLDLELRAQTTD